jgi:hypothetical protein
MLSIKHQSRYFRRSVYRNFVQPNKSFQHPQLCQNSIALVITIIEINLDDQIAKTTFFNTTNISQSFSRASMTNNTILYHERFKRSYYGVTLIKIDLVNNIY